MTPFCTADEKTELNSKRMSKYWGLTRDKTASIRHYRERGGGEVSEPFITAIIGGITLCYDDHTMIIKKEGQSTANGQFHTARFCGELTTTTKRPIIQLHQSHQLLYECIVKRNDETDFY